MTDQAERNAFWYDLLQGIFTGPNDPNYAIVIVRPFRIELEKMGNLPPEVWEASQ